MSTLVAEWAVDYIGVPWVDRGRSRDGWDCYGAVVVIYREVFGVRLPDYTARYGRATDRVAVAKLFFEETTSPRWHAVRREAARPPDVLQLSLAGQQHVGILVAPDRFLHVLAGRETCIERIHPHWTHRIEAVYRHEALA